MKDTPLAHARAGLDQCVHCGFCLQACPTYLTLEDENDSPRGRLVLMRGLLEGEIAPTDAALDTHISRCLGCRGCETACPSGVPFGHLLEATRATLRESRPTPFIGRVLLTVFASPVLLKSTMFFGRILRATRLARLLARLPGSMGTAFAMLAASAPSSRLQSPRGDAATDSRAAGSGSAVALLNGCVMNELFAHVHRASRYVLQANGYQLVAAPAQRCCGALHAHAGDLTKARELARVNIAAFEQSGAEHIAVDAAGCGAMLKEYPALFDAEPEWFARAREFSMRVRDVTELLEARGPAEGAPVDMTVAYDAPCHLQHAQKVVSAPLAVFHAIPGLRLVQGADSDKCCGAAGIYNLVEPVTSTAVLAPKLKELEQLNAAVVSTGNPGCMMQIGGGLLRDRHDVPVVHPVELLEYSYRLRK